MHCTEIPAAVPFCGHSKQRFYLRIFRAKSPTAECYREFFYFSLTQTPLLQIVYLEFFGLLTIWVFRFCLGYAIIVQLNLCEDANRLSVVVHKQRFKEVSLWLRNKMKISNGSSANPGSPVRCCRLQKAAGILFIH